MESEERNECRGSLSAREKTGDEMTRHILFRSDPPSSARANEVIERRKLTFLFLSFPNRFGMLRATSIPSAPATVAIGYPGHTPTPCHPKIQCSHCSNGAAGWFTDPKYFFSNPQFSKRFSTKLQQLDIAISKSDDKASVVLPRQIPDTPCHRPLTPQDNWAGKPPRIAMMENKGVRDDGLQSLTRPHSSAVAMTQSSGAHRTQLFGKNFNPQEKSMETGIYLKNPPCSKSRSCKPGLLQPSNTSITISVPAAPRLRPATPPSLRFPVKNTLRGPKCHAGESA